MSPIQKRAMRAERNKQGLDMNLVALIDIFTILLFFLLSSANGIESLPAQKGVKLPSSVVEATPKLTTIVAISTDEIRVDGRVVARVADVMGADGDLIAALQSELTAARAQPEVSKTLTIMGDKDIPYRLLRKVMVTAAQAEFVDVAFAVRNEV
jgi:biopolymer transport protein ExbD